MHRLPLVSLLLLSLAVAAPPILAAPPRRMPPSVDRAEPEVFGADTRLGRLSYRAGRGLRIGDTGLVLGGFSTATAEFLEGGDDRVASNEQESGGSNGELEGLNLFIFFDPAPFAHLFSELELGSASF